MLGPAGHRRHRPFRGREGTLIRQLLERVPELEVTVSATTRDRRPGERNGREYWFLTPEEFLERIDADEFLEHVQYVSGHRYGTLRSELDRIATDGRVALLELETEGALGVKHEVPGAVTIFISARSRSSSAGCASARPRAPARSASGSASRASSSCRRRVRPRRRERRARARRRRADRAGPRPPRSCRYHAAAMIHPRVDDLLGHVDSRYALVIVAAKRARQINNYHHQLGEGTFGDNLPPLSRPVEELPDHGLGGSLPGHARLQVLEVAEPAGRPAVSVRTCPVSAPR